MTTIAIPVFNAEQYLGRCLESVMAQTRRDFEVVVVDDYSTDGSVKLVEEFSKNCADINVRLIRQAKNLGVAEARNRAIDEARGDYILFIDSDDTLEPYCLEVLGGKAIASDAQIVIGSYYYNKVGEDIRREAIHEDFVARSNQDFLRFVYTVTRSSLLIYYVWNVLIDVRLLRDNDLRFRPLRKGEDQIFFLEMMRHVERAAVVSTPTYNYIQRTNSLSCYYTDGKIQTVEIETQINRMRDKLELLRVWQDNECYADMMYSYVRESLWMAFSMLRNRERLTPSFPTQGFHFLCGHPITLAQIFRHKGHRRFHLVMKCFSLLPARLQMTVLTLTLKLKK